MPLSLRVLGYSQLLATAIGLFGFGMFAMGQAGFLRSATMWLGLAFLIMTGLAGVWLLLGERRGVKLSLVVQGLSVIGFKGGLSYVATAGPFGAVLLATSGIGLSGGLFGRFAVMGNVRPALEASGSGFQVGIGFWPSPLSDATFALSINVAAVWFAAMLLRELRRPRRGELTPAGADGRASVAAGGAAAL